MAKIDLSKYGITGTTELVVLTSGDNYYCVNNENGKVYYWSSSEDSYYYIAESIDEFASFFR